MQTMTPPDADPRTRLAALRAELATLPERTVTARRSGDAEAWMQLLSRAEEIPTEVTVLEREVLALDASEAWAKVGPALASEHRAAALVAEAHQRLREHEVLPVPDETERQSYADHLIALDEVVAACSAAEAAWTEAGEVLRRALFDAELLDVAMARARLGLVDADRPPLREIKGSAVKVSGPLAKEIAAVGGYGPLLPSGSVPPRWLAHRLGRHVFDEPSDVDPGPTERARAAQAAAEAWRQGVQQRTAPVS